MKQRIGFGYTFDGMLVAFSVVTRFIRTVANKGFFALQRTLVEKNVVDEKIGKIGL